MKKQTRFILLLFCGLILLFWLQKPDDKLHLVFCDVGQGDAILITHKNDQILIDGGPDESVLACLSRHLPFWDRKIELVLLTHPDSDHFFGLTGVVERYAVGKFIANPFITRGNSDLERLAKLIEEKEIGIYSPSQGDNIKLGEIKLNVLWPGKAKLEEIEKLSSQATGKTGGFWVFDSSLVEPNQYSIVVNLNYANFNALLTGDLPAEESQLLSWQKKLFPVDVLKASHHGSGKDNPEELYRETKPEMVVFSVGKNSFGHPSLELIDKLKKTGAETRRTDLGRDVEIVSNGKSWLEYN
jgi:competence protein ComEC